MSAIWKTAYGIVTYMTRAQAKVEVTTVALQGSDLASRGQSNVSNKTSDRHGSLAGQKSKGRDPIENHNKATYVFVAVNRRLDHDDHYGHRTVAAYRRGHQHD